MGLFEKKIGPVFLKEDSTAKHDLVILESLYEEADSETKEKIEKDINAVKYGIKGEENIAFELKHSGIDMYILHDLYFQFGDLTAQIDYMIFTPAYTYVIECKNLYGDITVDEKGNFIRSSWYGKKKFKEGLYSPVTQNERHLEVIKQIRLADKGKLSGFLFEKFFDKNYVPLVVLSNPKTVLNDKFAKKEVKNKIIRADQLVSYIKEHDKLRSKDECNSFKYLEELGNYFLEKSIANPTDYTAKYKVEKDTEVVEDTTKSSEVKDKKTKKIKYDTSNLVEGSTCPKCGGTMVLRVNKKDPEKKFLGCSNFPKCWVTKSL